MIFNTTGKKFEKNNHIEMQELRKSHRKNLSKSIYFATQNEYYKGVIKNLSSGGAFIETGVKFKNGIKIKLVVPGANKYILIKCKIIHFNQTGIGVKFKSILEIKKLPLIKKSGIQENKPKKFSFKTAPTSNKSADHNSKND
jgi:predicted DNA binding protein